MGVCVCLFECECQCTMFAHIFKMITTEMEMNHTTQNKQNLAQHNKKINGRQFNR